MSGPKKITANFSEHEAALPRKKGILQDFRPGPGSEFEIALTNKTGSMYCSHIALCTLLLLPSMLVILHTYSSVFVHSRTWVFGSYIQQPCQTSDHGKNVKASINGPIYRRGQCSQSTMSMGMRWTTLHLHRQHVSSSSMSTFGNTSTGNNHVNVQ